MTNTPPAEALLTDTLAANPYPNLRRAQRAKQRLLEAGLATQDVVIKQHGEFFTIEAPGAGQPTEASANPAAKSAQPTAKQPVRMKATATTTGTTTAGAAAKGRTSK